jgi:hypothetical protein
MSKLKVVLGFMILPLFTALFVADRIVLVFLWWINAVEIQKWMFNEKHVLLSVVRVLVCAIIYVIFSLIFSLIF